MNIVCWNCRGTKAKGFRGLVKDLVNSHSVSMLILLETQVSGAIADNIIKGIGFDGISKVDDVGRAGGIWCLWDTNVWNVRMVSSSNQSLTLEVSWSGCSPWFLTAVYGSPHLSLRSMLWAYLRGMAENMTGPWCIIGDFNAVTSERERVGSQSSSPPRGMTDFVSIINDCNFIDLGFNGPWYTWQRNRLKERLDRALSNLDWRIKFAHASVTHLNKLKSDHSPLLLSLLENSAPNRRRRPFRMLASWFSHPNFEATVRNCWKLELDWVSVVNHLQAELQTWNKEVFGNIFERKKTAFQTAAWYYEETIYGTV